MPIIRLSDHLINLIAAGEVVERPVAVIRELIDNSIDAGATRIAIELIDGGLELIRVTDNGCGMNRKDALLAFERHATSKLKNPNDLESIATLGFRGEALASIASVARVRLVTRQADQPLGIEIALAAGGQPVVAECAAPLGTTLEVRSLFFNQPARKKFMKLPRTELARIRTHLSAIALVTPHIHITCKADGKEVDNFSLAASSHARARTIYGDELISVSSVGEVLRVEGGVTHPGTPQKAAAIILVNGRVVQDRMVLRAIREGYDSMLKSYELPGGFISIAIRADLVDVNVHPQKSEVRFRDSSAVFVAVRGAVKAALAQSLIAQAKVLGDHNNGSRRPLVFEHQTQLAQQSRDFSKFTGSASSSFNIPDNSNISYAGSSQANLALQQSVSVAEGASLGESYQQNIATQIHPSTDLTALSSIRLLGQALGCYLIGEDHDGLVAIDMHAAHERINFNRIRARMRERTVPIQELLFPVAVALTDEELAALEERSDYFNAFGFRWNVQLSGAGGVNLSAAPAFFASDRLSKVMQEALATCVRHDHAQPLEALTDAIAARLACHASVRSGDTLSERECYALLDELKVAESGSACPHGRPVIRRFERSEVECWFGRDK